MNQLLSPEALKYWKSIKIHKIVEFYLNKKKTMVFFTQVSYLFLSTFYGMLLFYMK